MIKVTPQQIKESSDDFFIIEIIKNDEMLPLCFNRGEYELFNLNKKDNNVILYKSFKEANIFATSKKQFIQASPSMRKFIYEFFVIRNLKEAIKEFKTRIDNYYLHWS